MLERCCYAERQRSVDEFNRRSEVKKRGVSLMPMKFPIGLYGPGLQQGFASLRVYLDGSVLLSHGGVEMGQGLNTKMIQVRF